MGDQLRLDCKEAIRKIKEVMKGTVSTNSDEKAQKGRTQEEVSKESMGEVAGSYADRVKKGILAAHNMAVTKVEVQKKKIRLIKATGMIGEGLSEMTEKLLVEKANIALVLMVEGEENRPTMVKFVGANKERGMGGVTYELNLLEAPEWLKKKTNMANFLLNMGSTADFKEQTFDIVVDWTPVSFEIESHIPTYNRPKDCHSHF